MIKIAVLLGILSLILITFLILELVKNKKLKRKIEFGYQALLMPFPNLSTILESGVLASEIRDHISNRIKWMIKNKASMKSLMEFCEELGLLYEIKKPTPGVGWLDQKSDLQLKIQEDVKSALNNVEIQEWIISSKPTQKELNKFNESFFKRIIPSGFHFDPLQKATA